MELSTSREADIPLDLMK